MCAIRYYLCRNSIRGQIKKLKRQRKEGEARGEQSLGSNLTLCPSVRGFLESARLSKLDRFGFSPIAKVFHFLGNLSYASDPNKHVPFAAEGEGGSLAVQLEKLCIKTSDDTIFGLGLRDFFLDWGALLELQFWSLCSRQSVKVLLLWLFNSEFS